jgi:hypothetical protein
MGHVSLMSVQLCSLMLDEELRTQVHTANRTRHSNRALSLNESSVNEFNQSRPPHDGRRLKV